MRASWCNARPHPGPLPQERENRLQPFAFIERADCSRFIIRSFIHQTCLLLGGLCLVGLPLRAANVITSDVCVYGGTSGGVIAAVAAARLGKNVSLVVFNNHVGGMTSGGLGVTDVGNTASIGGFAGEFYSRVGQAYGSTNRVYWFEPHVAEQTFLQMLNQAGVVIYTNQQLASVTMSNLVITQIVMTDGTAYRAREFIDTTYEGDLMAMAGVSCTWGREGTNVYNESLAGVVVNSVQYPCDPYVIPGNAASGLLPLIQSGSPGTNGQGDSRIQTYNYRLCLTQNATNQIAIIAPPNYTETNYELLHRYILAYTATNGSVPLNRLIDVQQLIPNGKTDINAYADVSTDFIGYNYTYPTNTYAGRQLICQQHKNYISGLLYYLATSTNVPLNVRTNMQTWGYAKDEFQDNGGWPYQIYVREARRMVSDYVMQLSDALGGRAATDSVSLASYTLDCHPDARFAVNGVSVTEGGIGTSVPFPYPVSYRSIIPKAGQCQNLFCTFALSASHVGFASVRMEPVFMMTSQSAGTAAAFAIDDNVPVQSVSYPQLAAQLLADGQILAWTNGLVTVTNGIILSVTNTTGVTTVGSWSAGSNTGGWPLPSGPYWTDGNAGKGSKYITFTPTLPASGQYQVYAWWVASGAAYRDAHIPVDIISAGATNRVYINEQANGSVWNLLLTTNFNAGTAGSVTIRNVGTTNYVVANAVQFVPVGNGSGPPLPGVTIVASDAVAGEFGNNPARFAIVSPAGTNAAPVTINYSVTGTARPGVDYTTLPGSVTLAAGMIATNIYVTPLGDSLTTNQTTVTLSLLTSANYVITNLASATAVILDRPINTWLRANFTAAELTNSAISGDAVDPDHDGLPNLMEYALGLSPKIPNPNPFQPAVTNGQFQLTWSQSLAATDVALTVEWSPDLKNWFSGSNYIQTVSLATLATNAWQTIQAIPATTTNRSGFFRVRVSRL